MLNDEQLKVLPERALAIARGDEWRIRHEQYCVGRDTTGPRERLYLVRELADALLARQREQERFDKLSPYAVHQPTCTTVLSVTSRCSCGLHGVLGVALRGEDAEWRDYKEMADGKD